MVEKHPKYITDSTGEELLAFPLNKFDLLMEELDGLEDIKLYDQGNKEDEEDRI